MSLQVLGTDRNARMAVAEFSSDDEHIGAMTRWDVMELTYWLDAEDGRELRQAECLVHGAVPVQAIQRIACKSHAVRVEVTDVLAAWASPGCRRLSDPTGISSRMETTMIREVSGNLLTADVDALVNTVNTTGVMGKGIALQFKRAYPAMFAAYEKAAKAGDLQPGRMHIWPTNQLDGPRYIINFPTKRHWRGASRIEDVASGLADLSRVIRELDIRSVAVPPLGCGNGGLAWSDVRPLIVSALGDLDGVDVLVYPPAGPPAAEEMLDNRAPVPLTRGRAALLAMMRRYQDATFEAPSIIEVQKLMYFLQVAGEQLKLRFVPHHYGPYADNLRAVLRELEGQYISGFGDGSRRVNEAEPLAIVPGHDDDVEAALADAVDTVARMHRVLELAEGFESAYGLELLASTHWVAATDRRAASDPKVAAEAVQRWTRRKERIFTTDHVEVAWEALRRNGWLPAA